MAYTIVKLYLKMINAFVSDNQLNIVVNGSKPLQPYITSVVPLSNYDRNDGLLLQWKVDLENLPTYCLNFYYRLYNSNETKISMCK